MDDFHAVCEMGAFIFFIFRREQGRYLSGQQTKYQVSTQIDVS